MKIKTLLIALLLLLGCASSGTHTATAGFPTRIDATEGQFLALLAEVRWKVTEKEEGFHIDPRGFVGTRFELEREDGRGFATVFVFDAEQGNGSVLVDASEALDGGSMLALIDGLRRIYDAAPTWRDRGVLFCLDHDPRHAVECPFEQDVAERQEQLRAEHGCEQTRWNPR